VCVTNEICLCLVDGQLTSVDMSGNLSELTAVKLPGFLILKNYIQIEGSEDFNFSNTKDASFTIWWEFGAHSKIFCYSSSFLNIPL
jgi:hypothetical protein